MKVFSRTQVSSKRGKIRRKRISELKIICKFEEI
jgi:hypothetical protein